MFLRFVKVNDTDSRRNPFTRTTKMTTSLAGRPEGRPPKRRKGRNPWTNLRFPGHSGRSLSKAQSGSPPLSPRRNCRPAICRSRKVRRRAKRRRGSSPVPQTRSSDRGLSGGQAKGMGLERVRGVWMLKGAEQWAMRDFLPKSNKSAYRRS